MMTPRENYLKWLKNEPYEWIPTSMDQLQFRPAFIPDHVARGMVAQQEPFAGEYGGKDLFGVEWYFEAEAEGSMEVGTLFEDIEDWENYVKFPDFDAMDWQGCAKANADYLNTDKIIYTTIYTGFFERLISFVGFENAAIALIDDEQKEAVHILFDRIADTYIDLIERMHKFFHVEFVEIHDDWGTQKSPMFSVATHREMILPYIRKVVDAAHAIGVFVEQHSCGKIDDFVPNIIASGVDTWRGQSIVDKAALVEKYGDQFKFGIEIRPKGKLDDKETLAFAKEVMEQYRDKRVWVMLTRVLSQQQKAEIYAYIRSLGGRGTLMQPDVTRQRPQLQFFLTT